MAKQIITFHEELRNAVLSDPDTRPEYDAFALQLNLSQQFGKQEKRTSLFIAETDAVHRKKRPN